jgi:RNA polymerase sigma-70 factor, ECF subfamily
LGIAGSSFLAAFATSAGSPLPDEAGREARLDAAIEQLHRNASETWPSISLELSIYAAHLGACVADAPAGSEPVAVLDTLHATDLYLACAAGRSAPNATELFVLNVLEPVGSAVHAIDGDPALLDDVRQRLLERLLLAGEGPPRILRYRGRSSLATWVGVAAQLVALDLLRAEGSRRRLAERAGADPLPLELDPELQYFKARYREDFKAALTVALAALPQRERTVVRLHTVAGLTMAKIASLLGVDESTVSRWIQRAREVILAQTQRELEARLGIRVAELPSLARLVTSQLDISVARLLGGEE